MQSGGSLLGISNTSNTNLNYTIDNNVNDQSVINSIQDELDQKKIKGDFTFNDHIREEKLRNQNL